jgi:hypothetical protein
MGNGRVQGGHVFDGLRKFLGVLREVSVQAAVAVPPGGRVSLPEVLAEELTDEWVGVQGIRLRMTLPSQQAGLTQLGQGPLPFRLPKRL